MQEIDLERLPTSNAGGCYYIHGGSAIGGIPDRRQHVFVVVGSVWVPSVDDCVVTE